MLIYQNSQLARGCLTIEDYMVSISYNEINVDKGECSVLNNNTYNLGTSITYGGYKWHVIDDDGKNVKLLMDAKQLSNMKHCTQDDDLNTDCGYNDTYGYHVYSWDKSLIQTFLNSDFYNDLVTKIGNDIKPSSVCNDSSRYGSITQGGKLKSEIVPSNNCLTTYSLYNVRLMTSKEYQTIYNNSLILDKEEWLYSNSIGDWWLMDANYSTLSSHINYINKGKYIYINGTINDKNSAQLIGIRPIIILERYN